MEKDTSRTRNYVADNAQITTQNNKKDAVRGMTNSSLGKRKKKQEKKNKYLQEWVDKALQQDVIENDSDFSENIYSPNFYNMHQQRMHSAMSDPSFCRFGVPVNPLGFGYPIEPSSLPYYNHTNNKPHHYIPQPNYTFSRNTFQTRKRSFNSRQNHITQNSVAPKPSNTNTSTELHFTSLPPVDMNASSVEDSQDQRRFSDPGLGSNGDAQDSSDSDDSNGSSNLVTVPKKIITTLVEQIHSLKELTSKLSRDVFDMRGEIEQLKQHSAWSRQSSTIAPASPLPVGNQTYTPGMLADAIREVRDSTKVREEAFMLRFKTLMDERAVNSSLYGALNGLDSVSESGRDIHEITRARINKLETECRLERLEEDLRALRLQNDLPYSSHNGSASRSAQRLRSFDSKMLESERERELEMEMLDLRREVQEAKASRDEAIEKSKSNERLVTILRKKLHNASTNGDSDATIPDPQQQQFHNNAISPIARNSTMLGHNSSSAGLTSRMSPGSGGPPNHNGYVTMSGPVTDLQYC